jgi:hypothetical protein
MTLRHTVPCVLIEKPLFVSPCNEEDSIYLKFSKKMIDYSVFVP